MNKILKNVTINMGDGGSFNPMDTNMGGIKKL